MARRRPTPSTFDGDENRGVVRDDSEVMNPQVVREWFFFPMRSTIQDHDSGK
jgi:hypothetical protein